MTEEADKITIQIKYKDVEKTFSGNREDVWLSVNKFFSEFLPSFNIANMLLLKVDLQRLVKDCEKLIAFSRDGANSLVSRSKLTDNETLALWLLAKYVGCQLGLIESDSASKEELQAKLGKSGKITNTRLGELAKKDVVMKTFDERYRITTFGVMQMQKEVLPRIKAKLSS